jgi:hypothetical protein
MKVIAYKAKFKTAGKTAEQILKDFTFGPKPSDEVIQGIIKAYDLIDGLGVAVMDNFTDDGYLLAGWNKKDEERIKELIYAFEQDPVVGTYVDDRDQFEKDWDAGDYDSPGSLSIDKDDVEIIEQLKR